MGAFPFFTERPERVMVIVRLSLATHVGCVAPFDAPPRQMIWCVEKREAPYGDNKGASPWLLGRIQPVVGLSASRFRLTHQFPIPSTDDQ
jgi:hypothetical protein